MNMAKRQEDRSRNLPKKLTTKEQDEWDNLILKLGLLDSWLMDEYIHDKSNLNFIWTNKQKGINQQMARLDRFYLGD